MATAGQWVEGARPRTLPAAISPVIVGTGAAAAVDGAHIGRALLCLLVALALQVGVNYANDYSDGVRGTDADRVGPLRLVGSGVAAPAAVRNAALLSFAIAAVAGLAVVALSQSWWLLLVGAAAILAAWFYTGGRRPYGYRALGEVSVFVFFGLVAVLGTMYVQAGHVTWAALVAAIGMGMLICAMLVVNNLRDAPKDGAVGKRTLAVVVGDQRTRLMYVALMTVPFALALTLAPFAPTTLLALLALPLAIAPARRVAAGVSGPALIACLRDTGRAQLAYGLLLGLGLALS